MWRKILPVGVLLWLITGLSAGAGESIQTPNSMQAGQEGSIWLEDEPLEAMPTPDSPASAWVDPLEPVNRVIFSFNDQVYFLVMKPVVTVYRDTVPARARICLRNAFKNLYVPVRLVNNALQGKVMGTGVEAGRFVINTTLGLGGLFDPARDYFRLAPSEEDLGQTLGVYGIGDRIYLCLPFLGPSTLRDSLGLGGDYFLNPLYYLTMNDWPVGLSIQAGEAINRNSLLDDEYEKLKEESFDFYVAVRDGYLQLRRHKIEQ